MGYSLKRQPADLGILIQQLKLCEKLRGLAEHNLWNVNC